MFVRDTGGSGPAVLLLHGWATTADVNFVHAYAPLAAGYRVIALDHRGHGRGLRTAAVFTFEDCADDAVALLGALGIGRAIAVGYSMGGPIALLAAARHPGVIKGLVLGATALDFSSTRRERALWHMLEFGEGVLRHGGARGMVQRLVREAVGDDPAVDEFRPWLSGELSRGDVNGIIDAGRALRHFDGRTIAARVRVPVAAVCTTEDQLVAPHKQRSLVRALGASCHELAADHDAPITRPIQFTAALCAAVNDVAEAMDRRDASAHAFAT
jgi:3-oxoadipate enol-lactonase